MIVADIGGAKFALASLQDAEALLQILNRAVPVREQFLKSPNWHEVFVEQAFGDRISVTIVQGPPLAQAEFDALKALESNLPNGGPAPGEVVAIAAEAP